jgi:predicted HNH restriction endonuclease
VKESEKICAEGRSIGKSERADHILKNVITKFGIVCYGCSKEYVYMYCSNMVSKTETGAKS